MKYIFIAGIGISLLAAAGFWYLQNYAHINDASLMTCMAVITQWLDNASISPVIGWGLFGVVSILLLRAKGKT